MNDTTVLSLSLNSENLRERETLLRGSGFEVVSVDNPIQARFEIEMGRCGIFISDVLEIDLFLLFKKACPRGLSVGIFHSKTHLTDKSSNYIDVEIEAAHGTEGLVRILRAHVQRVPKGA